jgi:hypothetical protein
MTDRRRLASDLDRARATTPRAEWHKFAADVATVLAGEWDGKGRDGRPACEDCGLAQAYRNHACSCPTGRARKHLGYLLERSE